MAGWLVTLGVARYGKEKEVEALAELTKWLTESGEDPVEPCGLFVDTRKPFLAASPDGLVGRQAVVEVKCPLNCAETSLAWRARHDPAFCLHTDLTSGQTRPVSAPP